LDDQPTDGDAPLLGVDEPSLLQGAQQNHGAGDRQRQPEDQIGAEFPAKAPGQRHSEQGGDGHLHERAGDRDGPHREEVVQGEMQADAEHQQDHADLGEFCRHRGVGDKARRVRTDQHAGEEVADDRRGPDPVRQRLEDKGEDEARDESSDQRRVMRHRGSFRYPRRAKPSSRVAEPTVQPCTTSEAITRGASSHLRCSRNITGSQGRFSSTGIGLRSRDPWGCCGPR